MSAEIVPAKTPLDFALEQIATSEVKDQVLRTAHALISTCLTQAMMQTTGKSAETIAAEAQAYARQLKELEKHLGSGFSAVPQPTRRAVAYTTPDKLPQPSTP